QALVEAKRAEARGDEGVIGHQPRHPPLAGCRPRPQQAEQRARLPITGIEARRPLEVSHGLVDASESSVDLRGEPMTLYVLRAGPENGLDLGQGPPEVRPGHRALARDRAGGAGGGGALEAVPEAADAAFNGPGLR